MTESTPIINKSVPRYTFLGGANEGPSKKARTLQCCLCASLAGLLILAMAIILTLYLKPKEVNSDNSNDTIDLERLMPTTFPLPEETFDEENLPSSNDQNQAFQIGLLSLRKKESVEDFLPIVPLDSPTFRHQLATPTSVEAQKMAQLGFVLNSGSAEINRRLGNVTNSEIKCKRPRKWFFKQSFKIPELCKNFTTPCRISSYRTANGTCNNLNHPTWGAALQPFRRILLPRYADGVTKPRDAAEEGLPSARKISLTIHRPVYKNDVNFTVMLAVWGQFIDHDITATALSKGKNGAPISCCQNYKKKNQHPECFPVILDKFDPFQMEYNITCMEFVRSAPAPICAFGPREQLNQVTSFLDGSVVYGSDENLMNDLRAFEGGELKMLKTSFGELLPISIDLTDGCNREEEFARGRYCFSSGDARANENLLLTSMHLLFAREHNLIARELAKINPSWMDEKVFQESRKIVGAEMQHITYSEFLPSILPDTLMKFLNMTPKESGFSNDYNSSINPTIANSFASAAFRFGHTLLPGLLKFLRSNATREEYIELHKMLFNPFKLFESEFLENFMTGASNSSTEKADVFFNKEVTQKLFHKDKTKLSGLDLVSLNIQRGRDHGLPSYPNWREVCNLSKPTSFEDLRDDFDEDTLEKLRKLYRSVDDLDLYTGSLAEKPVKGGLVGPTLTCLLADQFLRLKIGDRFWYETNEEPQKFTLDQLNEIRKTTLAKIICRTSNVEKLQRHVMRREGEGNELELCKNYNFIDLEPWREQN